MAINYPHFALPFQWAPADQGGLAAREVDQESIDEIGGCAEAILRTVVGERSTLPEFGRPQLEFNTDPELTRSQLADALIRWEPRVSSLITDNPDPADVETQVVRALISPADPEAVDNT
jgi:phage baseplate assembly protein W